MAGRHEIAVLEVLYTDFTELAYAGGKAWLMPIVDHASKVVLGWSLAERCDTDLARRAWRRARTRLRRYNKSLDGCIVHHDQDAIYTSHRWLDQLLLRDHVRVSYSLQGAKGNTEMESWNSRFKNENRSLLLEAGSLDELRTVVASRIRYHNRTRRHSVLGNQAPLVYLAQVLKSKPK